MGSLSSRVVVLLHGIRTHGRWQKQVTPALSAAGFIPYPLDYGKFSVSSLLNPVARSSAVEWLHHELDRLHTDAHAGKVSVIAHSFGTYILGRVLQKYRQHRFDKLILLGSILSREFPWGQMLDEWRVAYVHNEYGTLDQWPRFAARLVAGAGDSGSRGFITTHERLRNEKHAYTHSDYFTVGQCTTFWVPTLRRHVPDPDCVRRVQNVLSMVVAVLRHGWGPYTLPSNQLGRVHPGLKWVMSTPIKDIDSRWGFCGVVNVDSIGHDRSEDELRPALVHLVIHARGLGKLLRGISRTADSVEK